MNRRGSVILHVLVTGIIVALIAACILRVTMMTYLQTVRTNAATAQKRNDEGALSRVVAYWSAYGACSNAPGYNCGSAGALGSVGTCGCTCTPASSTDPTIYTAGSASSCALSIQSVDPMPNPL